jgi:hypothetical protein
MDQRKLRRYIKRGIAIAGLGLGLTAGVLIPAGMADASTGPAVQHRLITKTTQPSDPGLVTTLDSAWW